MVVVVGDLRGQGKTDEVWMDASRRGSDFYDSNSNIFLPKKSKLSRPAAAVGLDNNNSAATARWGLHGNSSVIASSSIARPIKLAEELRRRRRLAPSRKRS